MVQTQRHAGHLHPVHAVLLAGSLPLFLGALLSDWAYAASYQVHWTHFASWLIFGALLFSGFTLLWAAIDALRADVTRSRRRWIYLSLVAATFLLGLANALIHAKDAWGAMPEGLVLSLLVFLLAFAAVWVGFSRSPTGVRA